MSITINCQLLVPVECSFEVTERQLDVMAANGVDVRDEYAVADYYRAHLDQEVDGVYFRGLFRIADEDAHTTDMPEIEDWSVEGEAPERFWDDEDDT